MNEMSHGPSPLKALAQEEAKGFHQEHSAAAQLCLDNTTDHAEMSLGGPVPGTLHSCSLEFVFLIVLLGLFSDFPLAI